VQASGFFLLPAVLSWAWGYDGFVVINSMCQAERVVVSGGIGLGEYGREDVVAEFILMVNPLYPIMSVAMLNYKWCLALRSVLGTSGVWPK
jgi:hypothetical protein